MKRFLALALGAIVACAAPAVHALTSGIDKADMDPSVRIQDDLYLAVNGTWLKKTEIPADKSAYGAFTMLDDLSRERVRDIIEAAAAVKDAPQGSDTQKVGDLYRSFMDTQRIESLGLKPLDPLFARVNAIASYDDLYTLFGAFGKYGVSGPFGLYVSQDDKDSTRYIVRIDQSGLELPDRDYYLKPDERFVKARAAYVTYIETLLTLAGRPAAEAKSSADAILNLETLLASAQRTRVELRDPEKNYNPYEVAKLTDLAPGIAWTHLLDAAEVGKLTSVNIGQPEFFKVADAVIRTTPLSVWKDYCTFKLIDSFSDELPASVETAAFAFHGKAVNGTPQDIPRWKKAVALISGGGAGDFGCLGDVVGRLYVEKYFPPAAKARIDQLVHNLLSEYKQSIRELTWMTPETKVRALAKLAKYTVKIGYPVKWRDYSKLQVSPTDLMGDVIASSAVEYDRMISKLGKPVDRTEWGMTPQTVNAYYNSNLNEIVFPAAILQPPFFNPNADDAVNYGGIGAVIGHEISHGFDDQGSQYDGDGNLKNWWTDADRAAFKALTHRLVAEYDVCTPLPGKFVNGKLTLGENIADNSGLAIAYKAYHLSLGGKPAPVMDGYTGDQRFFIGWAQVWRERYREPLLIRLMLTDPHSPTQFRADVPPTNIDAFYAAFGIKPGDKLYRAPKERIKIW
ncbi:neutral endopeptidase [mine drainage metagenome]|uniref:Neutral endopeptidase n=1 Tax=mine drainage metagenome TaxID=410659 RepID=A0A1J5SCR1_9ZZZZ